MFVKIHNGVHDEVLATPPTGSASILATTCRAFVSSENNKFEKCSESRKRYPQLLERCIGSLTCF